MQTIDQKTFAIDVGKINDSYFLNIACIGIDAEVAGNVDVMKKWGIPKAWLYNASILYTFFRYKFKKIKVEYNNLKKEESYTIFTICNANYYGNGFLVAPNAKLDDGLFDLCYADRLSKIKIPRLLLKSRKGKHITSKYVHTERADQVRINADQEIMCNMDGETVIAREFQIELIKSGITIFNDLEFIEEILKKTNTYDINKV